MSKIHLPNVRKLFIPDPGFIIVDADLSGAEAMVAAWECGGQFKSDFTSGVKMHIETMRNFYPKEYAINQKHEPQYTKCKNMLYGSVYVGKPPGIAAAAAIPLSIVKSFQPWFFAKYPEIPGWHRSVERSLMTTREVKNRFGYRVHYFDRPEGLLPEAVNWLCQSTIAIVCQKGSVILHKEYSNVVQLLLQVHDSLIFQIRRRDIGILTQVRNRLNDITVPYDDPLRVPWDFKSSDKSWGGCTPINWEKIDALAA